MNPRERHDQHLEAELRARLRVLQNAPAPNLERGRARVLARAQNHFSTRVAPRGISLALAFGVSVAVLLVMVVLSSTLIATPVVTVALTRTDTNQARTLAPVVAPANALTRAPNYSQSARVASTPIPNAAPEPRLPMLESTLTVTH